MVVISSFGSADARPWVRAEAPRAEKTMQLVLVSPVSVLKGNRYLWIDGHHAADELPTQGGAESFQAEVKGAIPGAMVSVEHRRDRERRALRERR